MKLFVLVFIAFLGGCNPAVEEALNQEIGTARYYRFKGSSLDPIEGYMLIAKSKNQVSIVYYFQSEQGFGVMDVILEPEVNGPGHKVIYKKNKNKCSTPIMGNIQTSYETRFTTYLGEVAYTLSDIPKEQFIEEVSKGCIAN